MSKIAVCGPLNNGDIILAELLATYGFEVTVIRQHDNILDVSLLSQPLKNFSINKVLYVKNSRQFIRNIFKFKLVLSITGGVNGLMSYFYDWVTYVPFFPKIINLTTGSDITELALEKSFRGFRYRRLLRKSFHNYLSPYIKMVPSLAKLKLSNYSLLRCPYYLVSNEPLQTSNRKDKLIVLHASNIDWGGDNKNRVSTKGSDKFIRAFIRAVKNGLNSKCIILDRGPDRDAAKKIIVDANAESSFEFKSSVSHKELLELIKMSDIVADQFTGGATGGIGFEAMSVGKPVMVYYDTVITNMAYDNLPPVINVHTEEEIYEALMSITDEKRHELGVKSSTWIKNNINIYKANFSEFLFRICIALEVDYKNHLQNH